MRSEDESVSGIVVRCGMLSVQSEFEPFGRMCYEGMFLGAVCINSLVASIVFSHQLSKEVFEGCGDKNWRTTCLKKVAMIVVEKDNRRSIIYVMVESKQTHCKSNKGI
jgi:hypothetical protein